MSRSELLALARTAGQNAAMYVTTARPAGRVEVANTKSSPTDAVTEIDKASERLIRAAILAARPGDGIVGEEGDDVIGSSSVRWIIDPIDGTVNFVYGIPSYAVSIAAEVGGVVQVGYVINIVLGEEFGAIAGDGAFRFDGDRRIPLEATAPADLGHALVATGFNYVRAVRTRQAAAVAQMMPHVRDIRRIGSAALDLCALAAGRCDAYVEQGLKPWDLAAGGLIAREAGIELSGLDGVPNERLVMAAHPRIAGEFFGLVRACGF